MSNPFKSIKKVFKKVVKVVKKYALPALAIAAVVLTGGAALGALPALSSTIGSLGLSPVLTGVLTSAAKSAAFGFVGSALMGKDPIKGATVGFLTGGVVGGLSAGLGGSAMPLGDVGKAGGQLGGSLTTQAGLNTAASQSTAAAMQQAGLTPVTAGMGANMGNAAAALAPAGGSGGGILGGVGDFASKNPLVAGQVLSGLGSGIAAREQSREERRRQQRITDSYQGTDGLWLGEQQDAGDGRPEPGERFSGRYEYDPSLGRIRKVGA